MDKYLMLRLCGGFKLLRPISNWKNRWLGAIYLMTVTGRPPDWPARSPGDRFHRFARVSAGMAIVPAMMAMLMPATGASTRIIRSGIATPLITIRGGRNVFV